MRDSRFGYTLVYGVSSCSNFAHGVRVHGRHFHSSTAVRRCSAARPTALPPVWLMILVITLAGDGGTSGSAVVIARASRTDRCATRPRIAR